MRWLSLAWSRTLMPVCQGSGKNLELVHTAWGEFVLTPETCMVDKCHFLFNYSSLKYCMFSWFVFNLIQECCLIYFFMSLPTSTVHTLFKMSWWMCFGTVWPFRDAHSVSCVRLHDSFVESEPFRKLQVYLMRCFIPYLGFKKIYFFNFIYLFIKHKSLLFFVESYLLRSAFTLSSLIIWSPGNGIAVCYKPHVPVLLCHLWWFALRCLNRIRNVLVWNVPVIM